MEYEHVHRKWRSEDAESKRRAKGRVETKDFVWRNKLEAGLGIRGRIVYRNDQVDCVYACLDEWHGKGNERRFRFLPPTFEDWWFGWWGLIAWNNLRVNFRTREIARFWPFQRRIMTMRVYAKSSFYKCNSRKGIWIRYVSSSRYRQLI